MSNKAFGKMKKAGKTHNRGSPHKQHDTELGARNFSQQGTKLLIRGKH